MASSKDDDAIPGWKPGDYICFTFSDETAEARSSDELQALISDVRSAVNRHGFDLSSFGTTASFRKLFGRVRD